MTTTHRLGKIARLPYLIRAELNERLANNEPAPRILRWLNAEPEVQDVLDEQFDGRPITQQNISAWKQGGFLDWARFQESRAEARTFLEEADDLIDDVFVPEDEADQSGSFLDRLADRMGLSLMQLFRQAELREPGPDRTRELLHIAREMDRLRRSDHQRQRTALMLKRRYEEKLKEAEKQTKETVRYHFMERELLQHQVNRKRAEFLFGLADGTLKPREETEIRQFFMENAEKIRFYGLEELPAGAKLALLLEELRKIQRENAAAAAKAEDAEGEEEEGEEDEDAETEEPEDEDGTEEEEEESADEEKAADTEENTPKA